MIDIAYENLPERFVDSDFPSILSEAVGVGDRVQSLNGKDRVYVIGVIHSVFIRDDPGTRSYQLPLMILEVSDKPPK